ncbi:helix-turn-helix transcriptional regulator [Actinoplanes sp. NPDC051851]|uniref:helix-turn-helix domain-containing protein n=1 Tax=Actinoplanes sp. NPDC051851 TaxID=3154753 RepID=UPI00343D02F4
MSDNELGLFLRNRREAVTPAEAGLPAGGRRRTPGLRRAEVAMLAGVSVEYLIRLEQGRDRHPSPEVLAALAGPLRLTPAERTHLYKLSKAANGFACRSLAAAPPARTVRPMLHAVLDRLEPAAAVLINPLGELLAYTSGFRRLAAPIGLLDGVRPNLIRYVFTDPRARAAYPDWEHVADEQVSALKHGPFHSDPARLGLAEELTVLAGEVFRERVARLPGLPRAHGSVRWEQPGVGVLRLSYETLDLADDDGIRLVVYLPADQATGEALRESAPLRLVAG